MGRYLLVFALVGVCLYLFMDLYMQPPKDMKLAVVPQYEVVQLQLTHPLMPPSESDVAMGDMDHDLLGTSHVSVK